MNWIADPSGQTVDLRFNRHVVESYVETVENWSTDLFTQVVAAELISPNVVRLTLAGQLGAQEIIQIADVPNLAGKESFSLAIDPVE